ncbi:MAG: universal stress protein [Anaerolineae bacterium]|nr:universal stress protein [Anaerolineae bacterium]
MVEMPTMFRKILIPSDGTPVSVAAGRVGVRLARAQQSEVVFAYIVDTLVVEELASSLRKSRKQVQEEMNGRGRQYLATLSSMAHRESLISSEIICSGVPYIEIERMSRDMGIDLIVMGVGHKKMRGILIGDVTQRVIQSVDCPVLVVK